MLVYTKKRTKNCGTESCRFVSFVCVINPYACTPTTSQSIPVVPHVDPRTSHRRTHGSVGGGPCTPAAALAPDPGSALPPNVTLTPRC